MLAFGFNCVSGETLLQVKNSTVHGWDLNPGSLTETLLQEKYSTGRRWDLNPDSLTKTVLLEKNLGLLQIDIFFINSGLSSLPASYSSIFYIIQVLTISSQFILWEQAHHL